MHIKILLIYITFPGLEIIAYFFIYAVFFKKSRFFKEKTNVVEQVN